MNVLVAKGRRMLPPALILALFVLFSGVGAQASPGPTRHVAVVEDLISLLQAHPPLRTALERAIAKADLEGLVQQGKMQRCASCDEPIRLDARLCPHCGSAAAAASPGG